MTDISEQTHAEIRKLELDVLLLEWTSLRQEILSRVGFQFVITAGGTALASAVLTAALSLKDLAERYYLILCLPLISGIIGALHLIQDAAIILAARYLHHEVGRRVRELIPHNMDLLSWEHRLAAWRQSEGKGLASLGSFVGLGSALAPGVVTLVAFTLGALVRDDFRSDLGVGHLALFLVGLSMTLIDVGYRYRVSRGFRGIALASAAIKAESPEPVMPRVPDGT